MQRADKSRLPNISRQCIRVLTVSIMAGRKLVLEGEISIKSFILGLSVLIIPLIRTSFGHIDWVFDYLTGTPGKIVIAIYIAVINGLLLVVYKGPLYKVRLIFIIHTPLCIVLHRICNSYSMCVSYFCFVHMQMHASTNI